MSGDCLRIVASGTSCDCVRPCSSKWPEKNFGMDLKQLSREELEMAFYNIHTKNECLSKALKDNVKQIKRLNKIIKKNEEDRRRCLSPTKQLYEDRISQLEQANTFLQDKVLVLRHQLQSHSRLHAKAHRNSSHNSRSIHSTKTSQTHLSQLPIPNSENINRDEKHDSNEGLNVDLVENDNRILQLQSELEQNPSDAARVAENIELIRLRRLVKRQSSQLSTLNAHLEVADKELDQLRSSYNEASLENDKVLKQLMTEKQRLRETQNELIELGNLKQDIKILQEQVRDLQSERTLLRSNNDKLLEIASGKSEEDTSQQPKNDTDKEIIEKDAKEETEKIYSITQRATGRNSSHCKIDTILEGSKYSVSKRVSRIFVKHNWFKELFAKACSANTYDLDIEPTTELSLLKAFSHQAISDLFSKEFICPSTLNYTIMPLIQVDSMEDEDNDDDKKNEKVEEMSKKERSESESENMSGENYDASKNVNDGGGGDDKNLEDDVNSELSLNEAKFIFMQILKHELENYDSASNQLLHDRLENEEANTTNENNQAENTSTFRQPSSLVDYFWGIVGYKIFFPKKSQKIVEISEHSEDVSNDNTGNYAPGAQNSDNPPPYYTISISDQSFETINSLEGCILQIQNVDNNQCKRDSSSTNQEPKFDIGSEESQTIEITSYRTINSDLPQTSEEFIPGDFENKSKAEGDASTTNSTGMSSSTNQKISSEKENEMSKEIIKNGEIPVLKLGDTDAAPNLSRTLAHDENKDSATEKGSKGSEHNQTPIDKLHVVNDSNKCSCKSSPGARQYILEEHKPDSSRNVNDLESNNIQNLPDQEKTTFTVYNLNSETGSRDKIGILSLKKISCECNSRSITGRLTQDNQLPSASNNSETDQVGDKQETYPERSENFQSNKGPKPMSDGDNEQKQLKNDENEINHPLSVDRSAPLSENQMVEGFESAPLLTLLRGLLQKIMGEPVTSGPRFNVDDVQSSHVNNPDSAENIPQSSNDNTLTRNSKHENTNGVVQNNTNNIVKVSKDGLDPLSASKSFERNRESSTSKRNKSFQRTSDPGLSRFYTKSIETHTCNRSTGKNEKIGDVYYASSGQTLKKMAAADDSFRQNSNLLLTNSPRSHSRSPDRKISQTLNKDYGKPLSTNSPRSVNRSPDRKTPQTLNDKNHGKPSEIVKTTPSVRDRSPKKMIKENSLKNFELKKQVTPKAHDCLNPNRTKNNKLPVNSSEYSRSKTPRKYSGEGSACLPYVQKIFPPPLNQPHKCVESSKGNDELCEINTRQCNVNHDQAEPNLKLRSAASKPICSHEREFITNVKKLLELLNRNFDSNENYSADELSNDESESFCSDRRMAFCIPEDDGKRIDSPQNSGRVSSIDESENFCSDRRKAFCIPEDDGKRIVSPQNTGRISSIDEIESFCSDRRMAFCIPEDDGSRIDIPQNSGRISSGHNDCSSTQLSSEQSHPQECPTCLNKKLRLRQLNVSNDSPFSKNRKSYGKTNENDKRLINHKVDRSDHDTHRHTLRHPEMIIVVGKKLTIYESDKTEEK